MKCEPDAYSIDDLARDKKSSWEGVRNYQARNFLRDQMQVGDLAFFYHSNAEPSGIAGIMKIAKAGYPDPFAFKADHKYFDPKSLPTKPQWFSVDVQFVEKFSHVIALTLLKADPKLKGMLVLQKGSRLSIQPVSKAHFEHILKNYPR